MKLIGENKRLIKYLGESHGTDKQTAGPTATSLDTSLQIGKDGIGENLVKQADDALEARELIKGRVLDNNIDYDARMAAEELAKATRAEVVQVIGTKFVLYRESHSKPKDKRIQLVKPTKKRSL